jgi:hypothetical protein
MSLGPEAQRTLASVLDTLIPARAEPNAGGAGELGIASHIDGVIGESPELQPIIADGLAAAEAAAAARGATPFAELPEDDRRTILEEISVEHPGLLPSLIFHSYVGYYQHADVMRTLGLAARAPHPIGYEIEESDLSLLDAVRARPKLYRS